MVRMGTVTPDGTRAAALRLSHRLVVATLLYNVVEGVAAVWSGEVAGSIALLGFGLDSAIESAASVFALWRLRVEAAGADHDRVEAAEHRVHRFVGVSFLAIAVYVTVDAGWTLWSRSAPEPSLVGIGLAVASVVTMPVLTWLKLGAADRLGSAALRAEAKETLACSLLSVPLLLGLAANAWAGWWWADPVAALCMVPWLVHEGREGLEGESCCAGPGA